jgi:hypothetical protein
MFLDPALKMAGAASSQQGQTCAAYEVTSLDTEKTVGIGLAAREYAALEECVAFIPFRTTIVSVALQGLALAGYGVAKLI